IQEGGFPPVVAWLAETFQPSILGRLLHLGIRVASGWLGLNRDSDLSAELAAAIGDASFTDRTLLLMGIGTDVADGKLRLGPKGLELDWKPDRSRAYFDRVLETGKRIADGLHGDFVPNPSWKLGRVITPHPIGGAPMGSNPTEGVVDGNGEVFGHPGLYVADGSVMPASLGVNPSLTIAAVSDLFADRMLTRISTKRSIKPRVRPAAQVSVQPTT
ncbi:MAG: GMC family oxidoreductase, partial [Myxococcota bacterium]|nr:GMC family oxidoreductase [Myxococcota bacterium]